MSRISSDRARSAARRSNKVTIQPLWHAGLDQRFAKVMAKQRGAPARNDEAGVTQRNSGERPAARFADSANTKGVSAEAQSWRGWSSARRLVVGSLTVGYPVAPASAVHYGLESALPNGLALKAARTLQLREAFRRWTQIASRLAARAACHATSHITLSSADLPEIQVVLWATTQGWSVDVNTSDDASRRLFHALAPELQAQFGQAGLGLVEVTSSARPSEKC